MLTRKQLWRRRYRKNAHDKILAYQRVWQNENREKVRNYNRESRRLKQLARNGIISRPRLPSYQ